MTATALEVLPGGKKTYRSVEVARRQETTSWEMADAIWEDTESARVDRSTWSQTDFGEVLDDITAELQRDGHDYKRGYVADLRHTREAWPLEERVEGASFTAHYLLRSGSYPDRRARLERLREKSATGKVTAHAVKVWISERKPPAFKTFLQLVDERMRSSLKAAGHPWHTVTEGDRASIAHLLRSMAEEVESGAFPGRKS